MHQDANIKAIVVLTRLFFSLLVPYFFPSTKIMSKVVLYYPIHDVFHVNNDICFNITNLKIKILNIKI